MNTPVLNFSRNMNGKLFNKAFTTFRLHNPDLFTPGMSFRVVLNGQYLGDAVVRRVTYMYPHQITDYVSYLDTGYSTQQMIEALRRMYPGMNEKTLFDFSLLVYFQQPERPVRSSGRRKMNKEVRL